MNTRIVFSTFITTLIFTSQVFAQSLQDRLRPPLVAGHRGGTLDVSNNTLERFEEAIREGVEILEMDLRKTKDHVVIVFHDEKFKGQGAGCQRAVQDMTWEEVERCPLKLSGHKIPKFEDVLRMVNGRVVVNAEFKTADLIPAAVDLVAQNNALDWVYFQASSSQDEYRAARAQHPRVGLLVKANSEALFQWVLKLHDPYLVVIEMEKKFATKDRIAKVHAKGKLVSANSFKFGFDQELTGADCDKVYQRKIDIAVTNNIMGCLIQQREYFK